MGLDRFGACAYHTSKSKASLGFSSMAAMSIKGVLLVLLLAIAAAIGLYLYDCEVFKLEGGGKGKALSFAADQGCDDGSIIPQIKYYILESPQEGLFFVGKAAAVVAFCYVFK